MLKDLLFPVISVDVKHVYMVYSSHAQLQERSSHSKLQLTGQMWPSRCGLGLVCGQLQWNTASCSFLAVSHVGYFPGSALRSRLVVVSWLAWLQWLSTEIMSISVWRQYSPQALLHNHSTSCHCPQDGIIVTYNINTYQNFLSTCSLLSVFNTRWYLQYS